MDISYLILADHAESPGNGKTYANGLGWNVISLDFNGDNTDYGFYVCLGIDVEEDEADIEHNFKVMVQDPDGKELAFVDGAITIGRVAEELTMPIVQRLPLTLGMQCHFTESGPHAIIVEINDKPVARSRFYVIARDSFL